jgi:pimeloyl-[acyl-carrier protein] methyl ester esterase
MRELEHASSGQSLEKIRWGLEWLLKIDLREAFVSNSLPIVLLHGENDQVSSVQAAEHTAEIWENTQLCKIPRTGHVPFLSYPEQFISQVKSMFDQIENESNAK